jgi:hypothetical protein
MRTLVPFLLVLAACSSDLQDEEVVSTSEELHGCPLQEIDFTRQTGCQNDGFVEFCVPLNDTKLQDRIAKLEPGIRFLSSGGRARCDVTTQLLGMYPTAQPEQCTRRNVLRLKSWRDICKIASYPEVTRVVPTFFE